MIMLILHVFEDFTDIIMDIIITILITQTHTGIIMTRIIGDQAYI